LITAHPPWVLAQEAGYRLLRAWRRKRLDPSRAASKDCSFVPLRPLADGFLDSKSDEEHVLAIAKRIRDGEFPFFGHGWVKLGTPPRWDHDFVSGKSWENVDSHLLPLVRHDGSDVKVPWDLSRLQFLPLLARAHWLQPHGGHWDAGGRLLADWCSANPMGRGVNWTIAMEASLRAISLCLMGDILSGCAASPELFAFLARSLQEHLSYIHAHDEFSFLLTSNHYLSNVVGSMCISAHLSGREYDRSLRASWRSVQSEMFKQVYDDGGDAEASTGYHLLVLQMFDLAHRIALARGLTVQPAFSARLKKMFGFIQEISSADGRLPQIGDCDDGRVFWNSDDIRQFASPTPWDSLRVPGLSSGAAENQNSVRVFPRSGVATARNARAQVWFAAVPNGIGGKGSHTHNDKLSVLLDVAGKSLLVDSGTFAYTRDAAKRDLFRGTAAHNTVMVDAKEQNRFSAGPSKLFQMEDDAAVTPIQHETLAEGVLFTASHQGYRRLGVVHERVLDFNEQRLRVEDRINGRGDHELSFNWQVPGDWDVRITEATGPEVSATLECGVLKTRFRMQCALSMELTLLPTQISCAMGSSTPAHRLSARVRSTVPLRVTTYFEY
jgi:hypothetical protein